jgi:hypothetical protein
MLMKLNRFMTLTNYYSVLLVSWSEPGDRLFLREEDPFFSQVRGLSAFSASQPLEQCRAISFSNQFACVPHNFLVLYLQVMDAAQSTSF